VLCIGYAGLWTNDSSAHTIASALSFLCQLIRSSAVQGLGCVVNLVASFLLLATLTLFVGWAIYLERNATLPPSTPHILTARLASFGFLIHPIVLHFTGSDIGRWTAAEIIAVLSCQCFL
jgi:hypothetical protein